MAPSAGLFILAGGRVKPAIGTSSQSVAAQHFKGGGADWTATGPVAEVCPVLPAPRSGDLASAHGQASRGWGGASCRKPRAKAFASWPSLQGRGPGKPGQAASGDHLRVTTLKRGSKAGHCLSDGDAVRQVSGPRGCAPTPSCMPVHTRHAHPFPFRGDAPARPSGPDLLAHPGGFPVRQGRRLSMGKYWLTWMPDLFPLSLRCHPSHPSSALSSSQAPEPSSFFIPGPRAWDPFRDLS